MTDEKMQRGMGPLARLSAVETWVRAEYGGDMPEPLRLALYGDVQPADLVHIASGRNCMPRQKVPCHVFGCLDHIKGLHADEIGDPIWHAGCSKCALQSTIPAPRGTCGGDHLETVSDCGGCAWRTWHSTSDRN